MSVTIHSCSILLPRAQILDERINHAAYGSQQVLQYGLNNNKLSGLNYIASAPETCRRMSTIINSMIYYLCLNYYLYIPKSEIRDVNIVTHNFFKGTVISLFLFFLGRHKRQCKEALFWFIYCIYSSDSSYLHMYTFFLGNRVLKVIANHCKITIRSLFKNQ